jgi:hypothetical protein
MALPTVGGGYQLGDGNLSEVTLGDQGTVATATATATLTVAQITAGILSANPGTTAASYTLPTGTLIDATLTNAKVGSTFDLVIVNLGTSTGDITIVAGTGITLAGSATVTDGTSAQVRFVRTGDAAWTAYRIV